MAKQKTNKTDWPGNDIWSRGNIIGFAPDENSIPAAEKVLTKGGFGTVDATTDGKGWWVVCQGITDVYQVSARIEHGNFVCQCTCPSPKYPCKHALALLLYLSEHPEERTEPEVPKHNPTDFEALIRAVFQNHDDDTPRLIFADFLEENDEPDRAALIRMQCEKARHKVTSTRHKELAEEEKPLIAKLRKMVDPLPEDTAVQFDRGFICLQGYLLTFRDISTLPERFTKLFRDGWVETVRIVGRYFQTLEESHAGLFGFAGELDLRANPMNEGDLLSFVAQIGAWQTSGRLCRARVAPENQKQFDQLMALQQGQEPTEGIGGDHEQVHSALTPQMLNLLIRSGRICVAGRLYLDGSIGDRGVEQLVTSGLGKPEALYLSNSGFGELGMSALANASALADLIQFGINGTRLPHQAFRVLSQGTSLTRLHSLDLSGTDLGDAELAELVKATRFRELQRLDVQDNRLTAQGIANILQTTNYPALREIILAPNDLESKELLPLLLNARDRPELSIRLFDDISLIRRSETDGVRLYLTNQTAIPEAVLIGLKGCAAAKRVIGLMATHPILTPKGLDMLASALSPSMFRELEIRDTNLGNVGASAIVAAFKGYQLESLKLQFCRIQANGVAALANSSLLASVEVLDLSGNTIGKGGAEALTNSPHLGKLERLELTAQKVGSAEQKMLKGAFGKKLKL